MTRGIGLRLRLFVVTGSFGRQMSTDVYVDTGPDGECEEDTYRIGHLGPMLHFCVDLIGGLHVINHASKGIIEPWVPQACENYCQYYRDVYEKTRESLGDNFDEVYPCTEWDDVPDPGEMLEMMTERAGKHWYIRVD